MTLPDLPTKGKQIKQGKFLRTPVLELSFKHQSCHVGFSVWFFFLFLLNFMIGLILKLLNLNNSSTTLILVFLSISLTLDKCWAMVIDVKSCSLVIPGKVSKQENMLHGVHFSYITAHCTVENYGS